MIRPPYPFPKHWKRVYYGEVGRNNGEDVKDRSESVQEGTRQFEVTERGVDAESTLEEEEEFTPIPLFRDGEWVEGEGGYDAVEEDVGKAEIVLSEEWQKRFKRTAERREKRRVQESFADGADSFEISSKDNEVETRTLYGNEASKQILRLEASLNADFDRMIDRNNPVLWPEMPIGAIRGRS